jgi:hypothetical protein
MRAMQSDAPRVMALRAKIVVDSDRDVLPGVTFVGPGVVDHLVVDVQTLDPSFEYHAECVCD